MWLDVDDPIRRPDWNLANADILFESKDAAMASRAFTHLLRTYILIRVFGQTANKFEYFKMSIYGSKVKGSPSPIVSLIW